MKTNNLMKKSLLMTMILGLSAIFNFKNYNHPKVKGSGELYCNPIFIPRRTMFKGWMRENRRSTFNKTK
jgi:hypothetical protein